MPGGVARLLLSREALSPDKALNAAELGLLDKPFALWELLRGTSLRHIVCAVTKASADEAEKEPTEGGEAQEKESAPAKKKKGSDEPIFDAETRFYIPEERKYRAQVRFEKEGNGVGGLVLTCGLTIVLGVVLIKLIPVALSVVDSLL